MSGLRRQAAPLPSKLTIAAQAFADGRTTEGERMFEAVHAEILPLVQMTVRRFVSADLHEDAAQDALVRIWRSVRTGVAPEVRRHARFAAIDLHRSAGKHDEADRVELADDLPSPTPDAEERTDLVAPYAPQMWRDIATLAEAGWGQREIALKLGLAPSSVRRIATEIRADYHLRRGIA